MEYLVDRLLSVNDLHTLGGSPGAGKSVLLSWLLKTILHESEIFEHEIKNRPSFCGMLVTDRRIEHEIDMLKKMEIESEVAVNSLVEAGLNTDLLETGTSRSHIKLLEILLDNLGKSSPLQGPPPPGSLLIVDPFSIFTGPNPNAYMQVALRMMNIQMMAARRQWTMLGVMHGGKQKAGKDDRYIRAQDRILGTTAYTGSAATSMFLIDKEETGTGKPELHINPRVGQKLLIKLKWAGENVLIPDDEEDEVVEEACNDTDALILNLLAEPLTLSDLRSRMGLAGVSKATFYRHIKKLQEGQQIATEDGIVRRLDIVSC